MRGIRKMLALLLCLFLLSAFAATGYAVLKAPEIRLEDVSPDGYRTTVYDRDGSEIQILTGAESNRIYVTLDQIPAVLQDAVISIEDSRFYKHHGIDLRGMTRAAVRMVTRKKMEGGSTLTQQLVKNNVLIGWTEEKTVLEKVSRKLQEQYLSVKLENMTDKDWILENYLNTVNFGAGSWGVETAAMRYFGKDVWELDLSESAVLAAIIKSPSKYNPIVNPEDNAFRRKLVLQRMLELEKISQEEYDAALKDDVYDRIAENNISIKMETFSYFEDALVNQIINDLVTIKHLPEDEAWRRLYYGGLKIEATQDSTLQAILEEEINNPEYYPGNEQASGVIMDPQTGAVLAIVGGRGDKNASLVFNRATDDPRQPGSTIKVIGEYAAGINSGILTLGTPLDDAPYSYSDGTEIHNQSETYGGMTTVRDAIRSSNNIVAVKSLQSVGINRTYDYLKNFGLDHLDDSDKVEALALGGTHNGVTTLEMTAAYNAIANGGTYLHPRFYDRILDRNGNVILDKEREGRRVISQDTAALLTSALRDVITKGTGTSAAVPGVSLAGKSGTTQDKRDIWFVGFSSEHTLGIWAGFDDRSPQESSAYVKKIWQGVMKKASATVETGNLLSSPDLKEVTICTKCGKKAISGLCEKSLQGDMTRTEYYIPGTEPTESCDCHMAVEICTDSGMIASHYCLYASRVTKI